MASILNDMRVAVRRLAKERLFACTAIITLAIGIGANSAIFTLVNGVLLRPLPFSDPDRLVMPQAVLRGEAYDIFSLPVLLALQEHATTLSDVALFSPSEMTFGGDGVPEQVSGAAISANYFEVIGVPPLRGRLPRAGENEPGNSGVVLLSEALWQQRYGADETVVGRVVELNGWSYEVIGVMPAAASLPSELSYWVPLTYTELLTNPGNVLALSFHLVGRLAPGVTLEQASADVANVVEIAKRAGGMDNPNYTGTVQPLREYYIADARIPLLVLLGAVGLVLLIVCANLANLLLAQAASRNTDFAVRRALGASSGQLVRQLMTESLVLGLIGGTAGLLLGVWGAEALLAMMPPGLPRLPDVRLDATVTLFTLGLSLLAAVVFGLVPALHTRRATLATTLRQGGRGHVGDGGARTRSGLVLAETALAFALVIGAGLLIRSLGELRQVDPGFRADNALAFEVSLPPVRYNSDERINLFWDQLITNLEAAPGVTAAGAIQVLPLSGGNTVVTFDVEGRPPALPGEESTLDVRVATPGYFQALGVPLRRGRLFDANDRMGSVPVALLSETAVARYFPGEDPIGRRIIMGWAPSGAPVEGEVVGVVGDVRHSQLRSEAAPEIYFAAAQVPRIAMSVAVRTVGEPMAAAASATAAVHALDPNLAVNELRPMRDVVAASVATDRFMMLLLTAFSVMALLLAAIGIFGVISYGVVQRSREIGVRMALGADRGDVVRLIVAGAMRLAGGGVLLGLAGAFALTHVLQSLLFGVRATDPITFIAAGSVLLLVALLASTLPAWRAARTPPASVLNSE